jgi:hypothetical protein
MMLKRILVPLVIVSTAGCARQPVDVVPVGESFLPLAVGNTWIFQAEGHEDAVVPTSARRDTLSITGKAAMQRIEFFRLEGTWPGFSNGGLWIFRASTGNVYVAREPRVGGTPFLIFDAEVGQRWPLDETVHGCLSSLALLDDYAVVNTPAGRFDGAKEIGGGWIDCTDFGWTADFARGIGPVRWEAITIAGPTNWLLIEADIHDENLASQGGE